MMAMNGFARYVRAVCHLAAVGCNDERQNRIHPPPDPDTAMTLAMPTVATMFCNKV
jgi:hypothetical protein